MAAIANIYFKKEMLETILKTLNAKKENGVAIDIVINDETNDYGQNVSASVSQTKEQREAKAKKFFVANGSVVWVKGEVKLADKSKANKRGSAPSTNQAGDDTDELPF